MPTLGAKSNLIHRLETALDDNEDFIGSKPWNDLTSAYDSLDKAASEMEEELEEANERIEELEKELEEAKNRIEELEG